MAKTRKKGPSKRAKAAANRRSNSKQPEGDHIRSLAPAGAVRSFINEVIATKNATSEAGQGLSTATKRAEQQGVNVPAARIAARLLSKAKQDGLKARVLWEDVCYYLIECTDFDKIAPPGMFTPEESGGRRKREPVQEELPVPDPGFPEAAVAETDSAPTPVH